MSCRDIGPKVELQPGHHSRVCGSAYGVKIKNEHLTLLRNKQVFWDAVQEAEDAIDSHMMEYAQSLASQSPQQMQLTLLGGRRDVSALAAQSAIQVGQLPHHTINLACTTKSLAKPASQQWSGALSGARWH